MKSDACVYRTHTQSCADVQPKGLGSKRKDSDSNPNLQVKELIPSASVLYYNKGL